LSHRGAGPLPGQVRVEGCGQLFQGVRKLVDTSEPVMVQVGAEPQRVWPKSLLETGERSSWMCDSCSPQVTNGLEVFLQQ